MNLTASLNFDEINIKTLINERVLSNMVEPELVSREEIKNIKYYKRFLDIEGKNEFREVLLNKLFYEWEIQLGLPKASEIKQRFLEASNIIEENGALVFGNISTKENFENFLTAYSDIIATSGSKSILHTFVDLRNHHRILTDEPISKTLIHPLLIALLSYKMGGAIRIVDARGKDAEPISILAQDNMLHIDNTPFNDEYKILLMWEKGKVSGPKGQNFVYIPSTHKGSRNCFVNAGGEIWSTENASIFITEKSINKVFEFQNKINNSNKNLVVEVKDEEAPLCAVFAAGSLVHHRYRTNEGHSRSSIIIAFHRSKDNPGEFVNSSSPKSITDLLINFQNENSNEIFTDLLLNESLSIANKILEIFNTSKGTNIIPQTERQLSKEEIVVWRKKVTSAPTIEDIKLKSNILFSAIELNDGNLVSFICDKMMRFDKHGPLDLILYSDNHEESRKWARNRIREMNLGNMKLRLNNYSSIIAIPENNHLLSPHQLISICDSLTQILNDHRLFDIGKFDEKDNVSKENALKSIQQLLKDLKESFSRCYSIQNFLSTCLFTFWSADDIRLYLKKPNSEINKLAQLLLQNYISTALLTDFYLKQTTKD